MVFILFLNMIILQKFYVENFGLGKEDWETKKSNKLIHSDV